MRITPEYTQPNQTKLKTNKKQNKMKKLLLLALLSLSTLIGYSQTIVGEPAIGIVPAYNTIITLSASPQDSICGGGFSLINISPETDLSTITPSPNGNILAGNFYFNPPFDVPVTYTVHVEGTCGCVFDTIFTQTLDSTQQYGFHLFQIGGTGFYGVPWTDCSVGVRELSTAKKLVRVIDETGRDAELVPNRLLIYIYDDGTREKKVIIN